MPAYVLVLVLVASWSSAYAQSESLGDSLELEEGEIIEVQGPERQGPVDSTDFRPLSPRPPKLSLTISALHLAVFFPEVSLEVRPIPHLGVVATGGAMWYGDGAKVQELGGQFRYYPAGRHNGFHLGIEGFWGRFNLGETGSGNAFINALFDYRTFNVLGGGPLAGVKYVLNKGATLDLQVGVQAIGVDAEGLDDSRELRLYPILNFNFGKSW